MAAVDIDRSAREIYTENFKHPFLIKEISSIPIDWFSRMDAELWWMSPPCTPFTKRGFMRDLDDPRSVALKHLIHVVSAVRPTLVCLENVVGFESSKAFHHLHDQWTRVGYHIQTHTICPSNLGCPNRRPRVYCIASLDRLPDHLPPQSVESARISEFIDCNITPESDPSLWLERKTVDRYWRAMDRVALSDNAVVTACFAASYGKAIVRSGSYLETPSGYRRFSPREVARFLGFANTFQLPCRISTERQWHLLGNSLSLPAVRHVLAGLV